MREQARKSISFPLPVDLWKALLEVAEELRRTITAELEIAIERHMKERGKEWEPQPKRK
jgi:hypothetical protein